MQSPHSPSLIDQQLFAKFFPSAQSQSNLVIYMETKKSGDSLNNPLVETFSNNLKTYVMTYKERDVVHQFQSYFTLKLDGFVFNFLQNQKSTIWKYDQIMPFTH